MGSYQSIGVFPDVIVKNHQILVILHATKFVHLLEVYLSEGPKSWLLPCCTYFRLRFTLNWIQIWKKSLVDIAEVKLASFEKADVDPSADNEPDIDNGDDVVQDLIHIWGEKPKNNLPIPKSMEKMAVLAEVVLHWSVLWIRGMQKQKLLKNRKTILFSILLCLIDNCYDEIVK